MITEMLIWANVILALITAIIQFRCSAKLRGAGYSWLKFGWGMICLYWFGLYLFVAFSNPGDYDPVSFGAIFIRPAFTATLGLACADAIYRARSGGCK